MSAMQWFRLYADIVDDDKLRLLAFEDRWHFVALCSLKCEGLLDRIDDPLRERKIAVKMGVQQRELDEIKRRLMEVGLIDNNLHPLKWDKRQYKKPNLPDGEDLEGFNGYVYFIADIKLTTVKIGFSKNPWARVKEFQTGRPEKLSVVATVKTTGVSEIDIHDLFSDERAAGEWFTASTRIRSVIKQIKAKGLKTSSDVVDYVNSYVATKIATTETETDTDTEERTPKGVCASDDAPTLRPEHIIEEWNKAAPKLGKPTVRDLTDSRRQLLKARASQYAIDDFLSVFGKIERSPFLRGDTGWHGCNFDWVFKRANFQKILEGNYDE